MSRASDDELWRVSPCCTERVLKYYLDKRRIQRVKKVPSTETLRNVTVNDCFPEKL
jgi:hypothetical protein